MRSDTTLWCTDGSHDPISAPEISGAGWIIYDAVTEHKMYGDFFERSDQAISYKGEMIGNLSLHILRSALEQFMTSPHVLTNCFVIMKLHSRSHDEVEEGFRL